MRDIKCSQEARKRCPFDHPCDSEEKAYFDEGSPCDKFNKELTPPPPMTNADRIRAMSDEELARLLAEVENRRSAAGGGAVWKGAAHALQWLQQPAKEETT